jgi:hypothetical protein
MKKHDDLQSQAIYGDKKQFQARSTYFRRRASVVQVGDIEQLIV